MNPTIKARAGVRVFRPSRAKPVRILLPQPKKMHVSTPSFVMVMMGFTAVIVIGAVLLTLPISSQSREFTPPVDALFTATSAVCVTGLAVFDTGTYWSIFGQVVILLLMQIGGFGFMTSATLFLLILRRRVGLRERLLTSQSLGLERYGGLTGLVKRVVVFSLLAETLGGIVLYFRFLMDDSAGMAAWKAVFHAVSAFNNCGYDIMGNFRSLIDYQQDAWILLVIAALVILGGIGFITFEDWYHNRRFVKLSTDSKIVLTMTGLLLLVGTVFYLVAEFSNPETIGALSWPHKILVSFFQAVTPRTAGFAAVDIGRMTLGSLFFTMLLMFIGGASGSTAGGIKVNTFGILFFTAISTLKGREHPGAFGRQFLSEQINRALTLTMAYIAIVSIVTVMLSTTETHSLTTVLFETFSALGTVGLSTGITPDLSLAGRIIITLTMFIGRLGPLSMASTMVERQQKSSFQYPKALIRLG
jgi:trk system potassium uptake protein TrkH